MYILIKSMGGIAGDEPFSWTRVMWKGNDLKGVAKLIKEDKKLTIKNSFDNGEKISNNKLKELTDYYFRQDEYKLTDRNITKLLNPNGLYPYLTFTGDDKDVNEIWEVTYTLTEI